MCYTLDPSIPRCWVSRRRHPHIWVCVTCLPNDWLDVQSTGRKRSHTGRSPLEGRLRSRGFAMHCPYCSTKKTRVIDTSKGARGVRRRRECAVCGQRFNTVERAILTTPLVVKADERREEFDREKLLHGIRVACAKRPVATEAIEGLVDRVEARLREIGKAEVNAKVMGDMVIEGLKELDRVAYIRFAIVYLGLEDLEAVRAEIDRLMGPTEDG